MNTRHTDIESQEDEVLKDFEKNDFVSVPNLEEEMQFAKSAASNFVKRDSRINIRVSSADINMIRKIAIQEGLPYQTLIASILHKFVSGRLVERGK